MKIQIVSQYYYPDSFLITEIAEGFAQRGHQVSVVTGLPDYTTTRIPKEYRWFRKRKEIINDVYVRRVPTIARRRGLFFRVLNYFSFMLSSCIYALFTKQHSFDVIIANQTSPIFQAVAGTILKKRSRKNLFLYCYDLWPESLKAWGIKDSSAVFRLVRRFSSWIYQKCDIIGITSKPFKTYLIDICGVNKERIVYLPQFSEDYYKEIACSYDDNDCIDFLFAGNIGAVQNLETVLKAIPRMKTCNNFHFHIVGDGSQINSIKKMAFELGLDEIVTFHGQNAQEKMPRFYAMADCFLLTLRCDGFVGQTLPAKAIGYLCCGKPVLGSISGAGAELLRDCNCGVYADPDDVDKLALLMDDIVDDFDKYRIMGQNGRRYYEQNFTKEIFFDDLTALLGGN
ncbi:glycosyltransferase family 4 protein [Eubacteriales bacterium OttesenSCG-928-M02]|nr:glycosyltransferase family 4 protein [Eubacteriales bacterium OttesenSCG-928-M02]